MMAIFLVIGFMGTGFGIYLGIDTLTFKHRALTTTGTIIEIDSKHDDDTTLYTPIASFQTTDGQTLTVRSRVSSSYTSFSVGDKVEILYDPAKPSEARLATVGNQWLPTIFLIPFGLIFSLVGGYYFYSRLQLKKNKEWLARYGVSIMAKNSGLAIGTISLGESGGKESYQIKAEWLNPNDQKVYRFTSDYLWDDPTPFLNKEIKVLINPRNPKQYWIDTSFLPATTSAATAR